MPVSYTHLAYLTALGTMSSAATLGVALECARKSPILRKEISDVTIPLFANIHPVSYTHLLLSAKSFAQDKDFNYKFYGQIRTDFYYNSRANEETVDGLFYMYPKDKVYDATGKDLNETANGSFYTLYTRLGVDVQGPKLGRAKTSAKVEMDFRGS